jgi:thiosulfate/3-mercaptopyruvate sulfurtransferase
MLISAEQLFTELSSDIKPLVFDCRFAMPAPQFDANYGHNQYLQSHIPGAVYVHLERDLSASPTSSSGRHPLPAENVFLDKLQAWGLQPSLKAIIYDDSGALIAGRLWWMLRYWVGHPQVAVLDGGFGAWRRAGLPVEAQENTGLWCAERMQISPRYLRSTDDIRKMTGHERTGLLVDARNHDRFTGEQENIDPVAGHIPGAVNSPCADNLAPDGKFLQPGQLQKRFAPLLSMVDDSRQIIHSCGSGVTACHNILAMDIAGIHGTNLYAGSWSEWIRDPDNPVATGE